MLAVWDVTVSVLGILHLISGSEDSFVMSLGGLVYKGSALVGLLTIILTIIRSTQRTSCSDAEVGTQCSNDVNPTNLQQWVGSGIRRQTLDCLTLGI
jgi:hypothetical protein